MPAGTAFPLPRAAHGSRVVLAALAPDAAARLSPSWTAPTGDLGAGVALIWRQDVYMLLNGRTSFGFRDGISQPAVEGSGVPGTNPHEAPLRAGEFVLGYPDETGAVAALPDPDVLGRNGTYVVLRKLHTRVGAFRQCVRARAGHEGRAGAARRQDRRTVAERRTPGAQP